MTRIFNRATDPTAQRRPNYVYIGRPSKFGNPFSHQHNTLAKFRVPTRAAAIASYERWIRDQPELLAALPELVGKELWCWCRPPEGFQGRVLCHGQILVALIDGCKPEDVE